jgi:hypothetical protein
MLFFLVLTLLAVALMGGAWYGRLQERADWTRRLLRRGLDPHSLAPQRHGMPLEPLAPDADADAMRDAMDQMAREIERLSEGQRFVTEVLSERRVLPGPSSAPSERAPSPSSEPDAR